MRISNLGSISAFFPAFNDEETISELVANALNTLKSFTDDYEVIVVNDGSVDGTRHVLDELARECPRLRVAHHPVNRGYGAALRTGFAQASKDFVFYTDGDGQYDAREMAVLFPLMTDGVDVVNGYKLERADGRRRRLIGGAYNRVARFLFRLPIRDVDCDFRLIRRRAVEAIELQSSSGSICVELVSKLHARGCAFVETPVHHFPRQHGRSQFFTVRRVARTALDFSILWLKSAKARGDGSRDSSLQRADAV